MIVNESKGSHDNAITALFNSLDMIRHARVNALPQTANVLCACGQGFSAALKNGLWEDRVTAARGEGLRDVF